MAYTVLDTKNINKTKNIYTFGGSGTKPEREDIAENSKLIDYSSGQKFYYDPSKAAGSKWQLDKEPSGGSSGEGLPADFPAESSENANKFIGFDANGDYTAKDAPSGGGAEKFVVTLTKDNDTWTADKTIAEIVAADEANQVVVAEVPDQESGALLAVSLVTAQNDSGVNQAVFANIFPGSELTLYAIYGAAVEGVDEWDVQITPIPTSTNAPLIVTLTEDQQTADTFVGDKTYNEVNAAYTNGRNCVFYLNGGAAGVIYASVVSSLSINNNIAVYAYLFDSFKEIVGAPNDYITINLGG